jgi:hypothetical protein
VACPYLDCGDASQLPAEAESCPTCRRLVKVCPQCGSSNRAFANFCRVCGKALPETVGDWAGFKGGGQRLGLNRWPQARPLRESRLEEVLELRLGDACRSLVSSDRHLIAVAGNGEVKIVDVARGPASEIRLAASGEMTAEPCVSRGMLYLAAKEVRGRGRVVAFALGGLGLEEPRLEPRWEMGVPGIPIQALLALEGRLYLSLLLPDRRREVHLIEDADRDRPRDSQALLSVRRPSWLAANPPSRKVFFLSEEDGDLRVHWADHGATSNPRLATRSVTGAFLPLVDSVPIAVMGAKIFAVLGEAERLCRIDAQDGVFDLAMQADARDFALGGVRDGLVIDTSGLVFLAAQRRADLNPMERIKGPPVILKDCAAVIALQDGRLRVYDLRTPPLHQELRVSSGMEEVTALISFRNYIAAGDSAGTVKVFVLVAPHAAGAPSATPRTAGTP